MSRTAPYPRAFSSVLISSSLHDQQTVSHSEQPKNNVLLWLQEAPPMRSRGEHTPPDGVIKSYLDDSSSWHTSQCRSLPHIQQACEDSRALWKSKPKALLA